MDFGVTDRWAGKRTGYDSVGQYRRDRTAGGVDFAQQIQKTGKVTDVSCVDAYREYLKKRYGDVMIQGVGKDQKSMDGIGAGTAGTGNVIIAPNILEQMANDPKKAAYYEGQIQDYFASLPKCKAQLSAMGHEMHSSGVVIHPDGTVTYYISGDLKPEVRARIEARIKAEDAAKKKRKEKYRKRHEEVQERQRLETELAYRRQNMTELVAAQTVHMGRTIYGDSLQALNSVISDYDTENIVMAEIWK